MPKTGFKVFYQYSKTNPVDTLPPLNRINHKQALRNILVFSDNMTWEKNEI